MAEDKVSLLMEDWAIDFDVLDKDLQKAQWNKPSIYKLPATTTGGSSDNNKRSAAYFPHTVSFGPYHDDKGDHLKKMDPHKRRVLGHFLKRYKITLQKLVYSLTTTNYIWQQVDHIDDPSDPKELPIDIQKEVLPVLQHLMDAYDSLDDKWRQDQDGFMKLMILDGCFMLEILQWSSVYDDHKALSFGSTPTDTATDVRRNKRKTAGSSLRGSLDDYYYADNDPIFSFHGKLYFMSYIRRDMLMLENQISSDDLRRKGPSAGEDEYIIRSVMNLQESGVKFERSTNFCHLTDIRVEGHVLKLPVVDIDDTTESKLLNLMAFERFHVGAGNEVTSYVYFMDNIIDSSEDVKILKSSGVLINSIGSDKAVAKLFNELTKDATPDSENMLEKVVQKQLDKHCRNKWNEWRATLNHTYFKNPWALLSLLAAVLLLALTISQTFYSIYGYYKPWK
ncbi:hypothetical protein MKW92_051680 [Papaver armeniacum]|nr:hypothetical protein MKW92_051680 [Papaver armeniacum]